MLTVHKFHVPISDRIEIFIPGLRKLMDIKDQGKDLFVWALVETEDTQKTDILLAMRGTGHEVAMIDMQDMTFWKTVHMRTMPLVWHVWVDQDLPRA